MTNNGDPPVNWQACENATHPCAVGTLRGIHLSVGGGGAFALGFEGFGHGGLGGEAALVGDVGKEPVGLLVDEADGVTHAVLGNHVVERGVAAVADGFGEVFAVGAQACGEGVAGDVRLGEDMLVGEQCLEAGGKVVETVVVGGWPLGVGGIVVVFGIFGIACAVHHLAPGVEREEAEPHVGSDEEDVAGELDPRVVGIEVDSQQDEDERGHPADEVGEAHGEVVAVGVAVLVGALNGAFDAQRHTDTAPEVEHEKKAYGPHEPDAPPLGHVEDADSL